MFGLYSRGGYWHPLGFVALVPWLLALDAIPTVAGTARSGLLMSFAFVAAVFAWFGVAIGAFTGIGSATGLLVLLAAAPLLQLQLIAFALVRHLAGRRHGPVVRALAGASAWVATEWLVPRLLGDTLGHGLYPSRVLRQFADVGGAAGITFLLILVNECVAFAIAHRRGGPLTRARPLVLAASVLALMMGYGVVRLSTLNPTATATASTSTSTSTSTSASPAPTLLRIGMVQSSIVDYERLRLEMGAYEVVRHVLDTHMAMSRKAVENYQVDALLWSETVYPTTFGHPKSEEGADLDREILEFVTSAGVPLVFGTYDVDASGEYNAAAFIEPVAGALGFYRKTNPFPLTEYVPEWLDGPTFRRWLPWAGTWRPGDGARVFPLRLADGREIPVLPMICLDDVDTSLAIDGARQGAQVILAMSNDSWFTEYPVGANLHLAVAAFRSIETRLPQIRVTSNGVSAVIDATGTVIASTSMGERTLLVGEVPASEPPGTLMVAWGDWVGKAALALLVLLAGLSAIAALNRRAAHDAMPPATSTPAADADFRATVVVLSPSWRAAASVLRVVVLGGLLWTGAAQLSGDSERTSTLAQMWSFALLVLAPVAALWCIGRAFRATMRIEDGQLVLEQRDRLIEIPVKDIAALETWTLPIPGAGVWLHLASGRRWSQGIAVADPAALASALIRVGGPVRLADAASGHAAKLARTRAAVSPWRIDHPALKFLLFPLVPALPAFRLHQHIAFGGTFGEYYTYGLQAYLLALAIWWASWAIGLVLFAAALRVLIEAGTLLALALRPDSAIDARRGFEHVGRVLFFAGVPMWLLIRVWPWS